MSDAGGGLLFDASVLIDYRDSDMAVLELISRHVSRVYVLTPVLRPLINLAFCGALSENKAIHIAKAMHTNNPMHINERVMECFESELRRGLQCEDGDTSHGTLL